MTFFLFPTGDLKRQNRTQGQGGR